VEFCEIHVNLVKVTHKETAPLTTMNPIWEITSGFNNSIRDSIVYLEIMASEHILGRDGYFLLV